MREAAVYAGTRSTDNGSSLIGLWNKIHENAVFWMNIPIGSERENDLSLLDDAIASIVTSSITKVEYNHWHGLCSAAGWTSYGAIALSWCKDPAIADVWSGWLSSGFPLKPLPEFERPARFINPALLPQADSLSGIATWVKAQGYKDAATYDLALCAVIAALKTPLIFDIEAEKLRKLSPQISAFLKSRMLQKSGRNAEEEALLEVWSTSVKGTEYDVWEGR